MAWARNLKPCEDAYLFAVEAIYVICNSGMKQQVAQKIFDKVMLALRSGQSATKYFGHKGKVGAIDLIWKNQRDLFKQYQDAQDKLTFLESLPWVGGITKWHLAKNLGMDVVKPDRHLVRIASSYDTTPQEMCERLSKASGDKVSLVDYVIWRAANMKLA
jgi:hypothetical protein